MKNTSLAKTTRPRLPDVLRRPRLFRLFDEGRKSPVTWVSGPGGSGKTTLAASWLDTKKLPCIWYQLDEEDSDIATFFYYLGLAAKESAPRYKRPLPLLTPEYSLGIPTFTRHFFENLCNRLKPPYYLVFDNYQEVPEESSFHEMMKIGLSSLPSGINVIAISRADPPPVFTGMLAKSKVHLVGWSELQLTPEESKDLVKIQGIDDPHHKLSSWMHEKAQGWAAGLVLLTRGVKMKNINPEAIENLSPEMVFDYFANELFDRADASIKEFLLKTAFVPRLTLHLATDLTGEKAAGQILSELNRRNWFTEKRHQKELTYQYHSLFREFLLARAKKTFSQEMIFEIRRKVARLLESSGQAEDAAEIYLQSGDRQSLITIILSHAQLLVMQGRNAVLEKWLMAIPAEVIDKMPWLLYWKGICRLPFNPRESQNSFEKAFQLFKAEKDRAGIYLAWTGVVEAVELAFEDMHQLDRWIELLPALMRKYKGFPTKEIEVKVAAAMFSALVMRKPFHRDFDTWLKKALATQDLNSKTHLLFHLAFYYGTRGDYLQAEHVLTSLHDMAKSGDIRPLGLIKIKLAEQFCDWFTGYFDRSLGSGQEGLKIAEQSGVHVLDTMLLGHGAFAAFNCGDLTSAANVIDTITPSAERLRPWDRGFYYHLAATQAYLLGDLQKAQAYSELSLEYLNQVGVEISKIFWSLHLNALILHDLREYKNANMVLAQGYNINRDIKSRIVQCEHYFMKAYFALNRNQGKILLSCLKKALAIGKGIHFFGGYATWHPAAMSFLCAFALERGIEVEYVREFIRKRKLSPPILSNIAKLPFAFFANGGMMAFSATGWIWPEQWPWPVKVYTLGKFEVRMGDEMLAVSKKVQKKPLQLLKALIAAGGSEVREDHLTDMLWPDADGDAAYKALGVNIIRLRRLLGTAGAIVVKEGRVTLDPRLCWVDVWAFERMLDSSESGVRSSDLKSEKRKSAADIAMLEKALDLYKGPFLADGPEPWSVTLNEKLRDKFLRSINVMGTHFEQSREFKKAIAVYQRGIDVDDLAEPYYQQMMVCYRKLSRCAEAMSVYNRCRKTLATYDVEPSPETEALRDSLCRRE